MFSELVDQAIGRSGRSSRFLDIVAWARATIRDAANSAMFSQQLVEDQLVPTVDPYIWNVPVNFRKLRTVKYEIGDGIWPKYQPPGKVQGNGDTYRYYRASDYFAFAGVGNSPTNSPPSNLATFSTIDVAYYTFIQTLAYYAPGPAAAAGLPINLSASTINTRPAVYDRVLNTWSYLVGDVYVSTTGTPAGDAVAQLQVSNWLLRDWYDLCIEGTLAKIYKSVGDPRATLSFSLYNTYLTDLKATGADESLDY